MLKLLLITLKLMRKPLLKQLLLLLCWLLWSGRGARALLLSERGAVGGVRVLSRFSSSSSTGRLILVGL